MNNHEIIQAVAGIKSAIEADKHGGVRDFFFRRLIEAGILDSMPETALDPNRPFPSDWSAMQISIFDNGEPEPPKRKRRTIQRTKMRWGGNIKAWTRKRIDFRDHAQIAWQHNFYLWGHDIAERVASELLAERYIDDASADLMGQCVSNCGDTWRFGIPLLREAGSRWQRSHIVMAELGENGFPSRFAMTTPGGHFVTDAFVDEMSNGLPLMGNAIAQARLARHEALSPWATEIAAC